MSPVTVSPLSHRRVDLAPTLPGEVTAVSPGSLAMELGIEPGDRIVGINGQPLLDALDFQRLSSSTSSAPGCYCATTSSSRATSSGA